MFKNHFTVNSKEFVLLETQGKTTNQIVDEILLIIGK
jgi:hypothetical protein